MTTAAPAAAREAELRVLVLAPFGRDAEVTCETLRGAGIACRPCADLEELGREVRRGVGAVLVTAEALGIEGASAVARVLQPQEPWSSVPVVLASARAAAGAPAASLAALEHANTVTILERPIRLVTLRSVIRAVLRERARQYEVRALLAQQRENLERLEAERVVRERFVSLLAHDLRGPLSAASTAAKLIAARPEQLEHRRDLALRIDRNLLRVDRMIQDLLDANRLRAGQRLALELQRCDLAELARDVVADLPEADRARVRLEAPDRLEGDWAPDELTRAIWNLVANALKYGTPGALVRVEVRATPGGAEVSVHDEGGGIAPEEQAALFQPFHRARGADVRGRGWGLGLTLVRGCAEAHGGTLGLSSTPEAGTTFTMRLPLDARPYQPDAT